MSAAKGSCVPRLAGQLQPLAFLRPHPPADAVATPTAAAEGEPEEFVKATHPSS